MENLHGTKRYTVWGTLKAANIIAGEMYAELWANHRDEMKSKAIILSQVASEVIVEVWPDDERLNDLPWWLLSYDDFMSHCREIIENHKEEIIYV